MQCCIFMHAQLLCHNNALSAVILSCQIIYRSKINQRLLTFTFARTRWSSLLLFTLESCANRGDRWQLPVLSLGYKIALQSRFNSELGLLSLAIKIVGAPYRRCYFGGVLCSCPARHFCKFSKLAARRSRA